MTLLHNPKAGRGEYSEKNLKRALRAAGHKVDYHSTKERGWKKAIASAKGLIVVAGGDGTVGKVARELIGRKTSLSVLPLGTANNLARALGFTRPVRELIEQLDEVRGTDSMSGWCAGHGANVMSLKASEPACSRSIFDCREETPTT